MSNLFRRLPLSRLLLLCGLVLVLGVSATALAFALGTGPTPPPRPLADAIHEALSAALVEGVSAQIQLTDHLLEGANLASGGGEASQLTSSPLLSGASGRLWVSKDGHVRLELQSEKGDTEIYDDGNTVSIYDASSNTLYRYTIPAHEDAAAAGTGSDTPGSSAGAGGSAGTGDSPHEVPSLTKVEETIARLGAHANVSGATPTDVAGQAAYTVRVSPKEGGSLLAGAELSWDAVHGVPLRAAIYSTESSSPALELAATEVSYGPVEASVFEFEPPANAKVEEVKLPEHTGSHQGSAEGGEHPTVTTHGQGPATIAVLASKAKTGAAESPLPEELQKVKIGSTSATELSTELGTLLSFEREGVRYLIAGAVPASAVEAVAKGL